MPELTLLNIEEISRDVSRQKITFRHLRDELVDHICCDVEELMGRGLTFTDAYAAVRAEIGAGRLLMIAIPFPYVVFLQVFLTVTAKNKNFSINNTIFVLLLLAGVSVF